ncbi:2-hydroxyacid dehydrogenase [Novosphingobium album (ex Liu et al. 2023)]|uniref:D-glycerate dehydrogenase n=1 Tax=Novosphingobium album (ex Liu et al. 2023) TaxID=3031130 RepID=A0ABT5WWC9_9SPHN|nr:D-glycerate dehydrogenase [Novosphingobium album (ex Liu et al. 2023)]MDE8654156.1 D-glycerate dehydrogenase [Novosphingobium album (ex Liu et al. 2023)]
MTVVSDAPSAPPLDGPPHIVVTRRLLPATEARMAELFVARFNLDDTAMTRDQIAAAMRECDVLVPTVTDTIDAELIARAGPRLRLIASFGAGTEHIDLAAARARKIIVTNTPGVFTDDTADLTLALIIAVSRRFAAGVREIHEGRWKGWAPSALLGHSLSGKRLAIIGMGRIGQAVAHRARAFGMDIAYHNRHRLPGAVENMFSARFEPDLDRMIAQADVLSFHCPASPETHNLLDARRIATMKPDAYVVNTARGQLIDEDALIAALAEGRLGGAGLDVYSHEPAIDPRLFTLPNAVVMPHLGSATFEGREAAGERIIANIRFWADGHRPPDQVLPGW